MTAQQLTAIRERAEKATAGPWERDPSKNPSMQVVAKGNEVILYHHRHARQRDERVVLNFDFIAHARADIPDLLAYVAELEAELQELKSENPFCSCTSQLECNRWDDGTCLHCGFKRGQ